MRFNVVNKFNRGELDPRALDRLEVDKILNSCELMSNWMPMRLGPMQYRPGTENLFSLGDDAHLLPFISSSGNDALILISSTLMLPVINDEYTLNPTSSLTLNNSTFTTDVSSWTDASTGGGTFAWTTWDALGVASLQGGTGAVAKMWQTVGGTATDTVVTVVIKKNPVFVSIGTSGVDSKDIFQGHLGIGTHCLYLTEESMVALPTITLSNSTSIESLLQEVSITPGGYFYITLPDEIGDLSSIRYSQSADVMYISTSDTPQFKIERRGTRSWSIVSYQPDDGPFGLINNTAITLTPSALSGDINLTASESLFNETSVGRLYKLGSSGQIVSESVTAQNTGTGSVRVTGVGSSRQFKVEISGTFSATVTLQRSPDDLTWTDIKNYSSAQSDTYDDQFDNSIFYYRLWVKTGAYTSGTANISIVYTSGSIEGICRVTRYISPTIVTAQVLTPFGGVAATADWYAGEWYTGNYPSAVGLYEGRLWWSGKTKLWGSVSDNYASFDPTVEGGSAPIKRTIGFGPVDNVCWLSPSSRLLMGIASDIIGVRSSSFGEVLTNTNCNIKSGSTLGAANIDPVKLDDSVYYVYWSGTKLMQAVYAAEQDGHQSKDLMIVHPRICIDGIKRFAITRNPETRIYILLNTGELRVYLIDQSEDVAAWSRIVTDGVIDDICVMPDTPEDAVYLIVTRGGIKYLERMCDLDDATSHYFDNATILTNTSSLTITDLGRFDGETVGGWGVVTGESEGFDLGDIVVSGNQATLPATYSTLIIGRRYTADYKSGKMAGYIQGVVLGSRKRITGVGFNLIDYMPGALTVGPDFDTLDDMPGDEGVTGKGITGTHVIDTYDELPFEFNGDWEVDPRICVRATKPCTIISLVYSVIQDGDTTNNQG